MRTVQASAKRSLTDLAETRQVSRPIAGQPHCAVCGGRFTPRAKWVLALDRRRAFHVACIDAFLAASSGRDINN